MIEDDRLNILRCGDINMYKEYKLKMRDSKEVYLYKWDNVEKSDIKAVVHIVHGMAEHATRYDWFASELNKAGYVVYADDHRGHGKSADSISDQGYISDNDGFHTMVDDQNEIISYIKNDMPNKKVYIFGHSMGSFISQRFMEKYGNTVSGVILSGSNGKRGLELEAGIIICRIMMAISGRHGSGKIADNLSFGSYNDKYENSRTKFDWLSRDSEEVDKYILDPYCGAVFPISFFYDFLKGLKTIHTKENLNNIPKELPVRIISGTMDPVGNYGEGVLNLVETMKNLNIKDLSYKLYKGARHELTNEINKQEVADDVIEWLNSHVSVKETVRIGE